MHVVKSLLLFNNTEFFIDQEILIIIYNQYIKPKIVPGEKIIFLCIKISDLV